MQSARIMPHVASLPPRTRIYAFGDIHGRADLLQDMITRIEDDLRRRPIARAFEVYLGDYIDRGPDSCGVVDLLAARMVRNHAVCLRGNHEAIFANFLQDPAAMCEWMSIGALQTLQSYGVPFSSNPTPHQMHHALHERLPRTHGLFLQCLNDYFVCGDFMFVHAGIRPGVPIERQESHDLHWIRREFLDCTDDHGVFVVHGHTSVPHPDIRSNRINIDTGAWRTGVLTCIAIEGTDITVL
jgi:serine/threonine protein phosphatase 1